jgi:D-3-phosphoglycerate dehydrogenase
MTDEQLIPTVKRYGRQTPFPVDRAVPPIVLKTQRDEKPEILVINSIAQVGLKRFPPELYSVVNESKDPQAILVRSQDLHKYEFGPSLRAVGRAGAGVNNIPVLALSKRGIPVFNAPGANANAVKELVLAGMLMAVRNLGPALEFVHGLHGDDDLNKKIEDGKKHFTGFELSGDTLGVIGLGKIGSLVADAAIRLGMNVLGFDPHITVEAAWNVPSQVRRANSVDEILKGSHFVSLHVPLFEKTKHLVNAKNIDHFRDDAVLLNFSREGVVADEAVLKGLSSRRLKWYVTDFPSPALIGEAGVIALPHLGASTSEAEDNSAVMVVDELRDYLERGNLHNAVNFPDASMAREAPYRIAIANANVPDMLGRISHTLGKRKINIHNMLNKSKGEMAYTLVDADTPISADDVDELCGVNGVLAVRYLPLDG